MFQQRLVVLGLALLLALASVMLLDSAAQAVSVPTRAAAEDQRCQQIAPAQPLACSPIVAAGDKPDTIAVNPVTNKFYVANLGNDNVAVIDSSDHGTTDGTEVTSIKAGPGSGPIPGQVRADQSPYTAAEGLPPPSIMPGEEWHYLKGTAEPPTDWNTVGFDDSSWGVGPSGIGYGDFDDATALDDMRNNYASLYLRKTFNVGDPSAITNLLLRMDYDDSFVAYLNGVEVARSNVKGSPPPHDTLATASHEASGGNNTVHPVEEFDITTFISDLMISGENVLALQGHNLKLSSSDFSLIPSLIPSLSGVDSVPPVVAITTPSDGASYRQGQSVLADYSCADEIDGSGIATCVGDMAAGVAVDTATLGAHRFTLTGTDIAGNSATSIHNYTVISASGESRSSPGFALEIADLVHQLINQRRQSHGLSPLGIDPDLAEIARSHSADMAEHNYFDHENSAGESPTDRGAAQGYDCRKDYGNYYTYGIAENIFQGWLYSSITYRGGTEQKNWNSTQEIAEGAVEGWINSPGHRANILNDTYDQEGIGVAVARNDKVYVTQDFC